MSLKCNEDENKKTSSETSESSEYFAANSDSNENQFHGFQKLPYVLLEPIDIGPYLKRPTDRKLANENEPSKMPSSHKLDYQKGLTKLCHVKLFREDLEHLRRKIKGQTVLEPYISCRICKKQYCEEKKLKLHLQLKHMIIYDQKPKKRVSFSDKVIIHEVTEYHRCRKCTKVYNTYDLLKVHMKREHKKRKCYICNYCQKSFVDRSIFKVHIKLHCDNCSQLFPSKTLYNIHRKDICKIFKTYNCRSCHQGFLSYLDLTEHMYHHSDSVVFICDYCKDRFVTKTELNKHINENHTFTEQQKLTKEFNEESDLNINKENFNEEANNKLRVFLEKPLDRYTCEKCPETFVSLKELLKHLWTHADTKQDDEGKVEITTFNVKEKLPLKFQPKIILEKIDSKLQEYKFNKIPSAGDLNEKENKMQQVTKTTSLNEGTQRNNNQGALIDAKSNKTLISKYQCQYCHKYLACGYNLRRHIKTVHETPNTEQLFCYSCEETFVWPSLLLTHKCLRQNIPEMPFDDARPEILLENPEMFQDNLAADYDNVNECIDFEIPAPIVELTEYDTNYIPVDYVINKDMLQSLGYNVITQEVPIEY